MAEKPRKIVAYIGEGSGEVVYDRRSKSKYPATHQAHKYNYEGLPSGLKEPKETKVSVPATASEPEKIKTVLEGQPIAFGHLEYPSNLLVMSVNKDIYDSNKHMFYVFPKVDKIEDVTPDDLIVFYEKIHKRKFVYDEETRMFEDVTYKNQEEVVVEDEPTSDGSEGLVAGESGFPEGDTGGDKPVTDDTDPLDDDDPLEN
jgi:hypothetical protein